MKGKAPHRSNPYKKTAGRFAGGVIIGASMLIPGVSGGTMAIILGLYDSLVQAVSRLTRSPRKSCLLLASVAGGGLVGVLCFSRLLLALVQAYRQPALFFFMGAVLGSIPLLVKKADVTRFAPDVPLFILCGLLAAVLLGAAPAGLISPDPHSLSGYLLLAAAGIVLAVALVLPGISASYLLLVLGLYEPVLEAVANRSLGILLLLGGGVLVGILCTTRLLEKAMANHPQPTYLLIIGFVAAAVREVFPGLPAGWELLRCVVLLLAGIAAVFGLSRLAGTRESR